MKKIGISPTYLSKCERDEFPPPSEDRVREIAKILGCAWMICWQGWPGCPATSRTIMHGS
ncbi:MAG: helix-turn-helix domain-containing protein [Acidiferrobacterales bacterium]